MHQLIMVQLALNHGQPFLDFNQLNIMQFGINLALRLRGNKYCIEAFVKLYWMHFLKNSLNLNLNSFPWFNKRTAK